MKTSCLQSYCVLAVAVAATTSTCSVVEGLSTKSQSFSRADILGRLLPPSAAELFSPSKGSSSVAMDQQQDLSSSPLHHHQQQPPTSRRGVLKKSAVLGGFCGWILAPKLRPVMAAEIDDSAVLVQGTVTAPSSYAVRSTTETMTPVPALYITCRPDRPDNVPQAILEGSFGKAPPVLTARIENPTFPLNFRLTSSDLTPEGAPNDEDSNNDIWWRQDDLIVSARLDMDGIAATRSPDDLVGRGLYSGKGTSSNSATVVALGGRGAFGKFATKK